MLKQTIVVVAAAGAIVMAGCASDATETAETPVAEGDAARAIGSVSDDTEASADGGDIPLSLSLVNDGDNDAPRVDGDTGVEELHALADETAGENPTSEPGPAIEDPAPDEGAAASNDPEVDGLDAPRDELSIENANYSFEIRDSVNLEPQSLPVAPDAMVAVSFVTTRPGTLVIAGLNLSAPTNGDVAQLIFEVGSSGTHVVELISEDGITETVATVIVG